MSEKDERDFPYGRDYSKRIRCRKCGGLGYDHEMKTLPTRRQRSITGMHKPRKPRKLCPECYAWVTSHRNEGLKAPNE